MESKETEKPAQLTVEQLQEAMVEEAGILRQTQDRVKALEQLLFVLEYGIDLLVRPAQEDDDE